ncbi:hypothetical protein BVG19_g4832 [[Candida] boidinii]|nr:hypothetical protein BVG19_g4832 [[Candida] boidinii]OWB51271.1 hypothetical protein B5S27_g2831 [[Candida] boidinii]OWB68628.1 hypothetical protein B5S30_g4012 [[Candida] boidinii]OWB86125.1 hypothetical protein B5S33_g4807 [[Candida] boidinii]GMF60257.1 unnamed protein product [[Candida] boidinii]
MEDFEKIEHGSEIDHSFSRKAKDIASGFVGGAVQVLVGQPFDLVKVRMQAGQYHSPITCFTDSLAKEGPLVFYKGTLYPLFGVGACVSIQFYGFHEAKRQILKYYPNQDHLTLGQFYMAGAFAGIVNTPVSSPVEQLRILMQTQKPDKTTSINSKYSYNGPNDAIKKILETDGLKGLFRGSTITLFREIQAYGVWFLSYEYMMQQACKRQNIKREDIPTLQLVLYGGLAGEALWLASYPLDVIKSKIQSDSFNKDVSKYKGKIVPVVKDILRNEGIYGFFRGIAPALLRALPVSAATFTSVEFALRVLG